MHHQVTWKTLFLAICISTFAAAANAQWQWVDKDGRKTFSDRPPPSDIADKNILKRPLVAAKAAAASALVTLGSEVDVKSPAVSVPKANALKLSGKDVELEAKKKKADDEEAAKKKAGEEKIAKAKSENCERAKTSLATLQSGVRISSVNALGEREVFDDTKRTTDAKRIQEIIDASC